MGMPLPDVLFSEFVMAAAEERMRDKSAFALVSSPIIDQAKRDVNTSTANLEDIR